MMTDVPQSLSQVLNSVTLQGLPSFVNAGDRITLSLTPDIAPVGGQLPKVLADLVAGEVLATLDIDPGPLLDWIIDAVGMDGWSKDIEFDQLINAAPSELDDRSNTRRALPHLVPNTSAVLSTSPNVRGAVSKLSFTRNTDAAPSRLTGNITKPGVLGNIDPNITVEVRVFDEAGRRLSAGADYFVSQDFVPSLVFPPVAVLSRAQQPTVRRSVSIHVGVEYTPPGGAKTTIIQDLGPFPLDLATVEVPVVAVLARHPLVPGRSPGHVFVGVPGNSSLDNLGQILAATSLLRGVTRNLDTVLRLFGVPVPTTISETLRVLGFLPTVTTDFRFGKGDVLGLWAFFADWQYIMSAAIVLGNPSRRAFYATPDRWRQWAGFSLWPGPLGVGLIPDLTRPIGSAATVGTVQDDLPLSGGSTYDNMITSVNFPAV